MLCVSETACCHGDQSFEKRMRKRKDLPPFRRNGTKMQFLQPKVLDQSSDCVNSSARFPGSIFPTPGSSTPELTDSHRGLPDQAEAPQAALRPAPALILVLLPLPSAPSASQPRFLPHQTAGLLSPHVRVVAEIPPTNYHRLPNQGELMVTLCQNLIWSELESLYVYVC